MSKNYNPTTYSDGDIRDGADFTGQDNKINTAVGALEGTGYTDSTEMSIAENYRAIGQTKDGSSGSAWDPTENLHDHDTRLDTVETTLTTIYSDISNHGHYVNQIWDNIILARQTALDAANANIAANTALIAANLAKIYETQDNAGGTLFDKDLMNNYWLYDKLTAGMSPGHGHTQRDFSGAFDDFVTEDELNLVKGSPSWNQVTMNLWTIADWLYNRHAPGHTHDPADVSGYSDFVTQTQLDSEIKGIPGWVAGQTLYAAYLEREDMKSGGSSGWTSAMNLLAHESRLDVLETNDTTQDALLDLLDARLDDVEGPEYGLTAAQTSTVTGVRLIHPGTGGTAEGLYTLAFTSTTPYNKLRWGAGAQVDLDLGTNIYVLNDGAGGYVNAEVTIGELPSSSTSDSIRVYPMNLGDVYDKLEEDAAAQNVAAHINYTHGDALVTKPVFTVVGGTMDINYSNVAADIDGSRHPLAAQLSGSVTMTINKSGGGTLSATEAKVDAIIIKDDDSIDTVLGTAFPLATGMTLFPTIPSGAVLAQYVYIPGNRGGSPYLVDGDLIPPDRVFDWNAARQYILDGHDQHGSGVDQKYGWTIEQPTKITGIALHIDRLFVVTQPSAVTGVVLTQLNDTDAHVGHYNTSPIGTYDLEYELTGGPTRKLRWGGSSSTWVTITGAGSYILPDASGTTGVLAVIADPSAMPGVTTSDANRYVGSLPVPGTGRYTVAYDASAGTLTFDGGTPLVINLATGIYHVEGSDGKYVGVNIDNLDQLPSANASDKVLVADASLMGLDFKIRQIMRFLNTVGAGAPSGSNSRTFKIGHGYDDGWFKLQFGSDTLDKWLQYDSTRDDIYTNADITAGPGKTFRVEGSTHHPGEFKDILEDRKFWKMGSDFHAWDVSASSGYVSDGVNFVEGDGASVGMELTAYKQWYSDQTGGSEEYAFVHSFLLEDDFTNWPEDPPDRPGYWGKFSTDSTHPIDNRIFMDIFHKGQTQAAPIISTGSGGYGQRETSEVAGEIFEQEVAGRHLGDFPGGVDWTTGDEVVMVVRAYSRAGNRVRFHGAGIQYPRKLD